MNSGSSEYPLPPPPPLSPQTSTSPPPSAPLLAYSEIWTAEALYTLPFFGCDDRNFRFYSFSKHASLEALNLFEELRTRALPERWSDLCGNPLTCGRVTAPDSPQVNSGPVLAGKLSELLDTGNCSYILILKAKCMETSRDGASANLDGDTIYQWVRYVSL